MKNKFLSIVFLSLLVAFGMSSGVGTASAQVSSLPSGCSSTMGTSTTTGVPCSGTGTVNTSFMAGCTSIFGFSTATGLACNGTTSASTNFFPGCTSIMGFSTVTGLPCNGGMTATTSFLPGCSSTLGTSTMNGLPCSGGTVALPYLAGCSTTFGFSTVNGQPCNGTASAVIFPGTGVIVTPGLPTTGVGGNSSDNLSLLIGSGLISLFGLAYFGRRFLANRTA